MGIWIELTTLIIPGLNDSESELRDMAGFIANLDPGIPWHLSAYFPMYRSDIPPTDRITIDRALDIGKEAGLEYVYAGNI